MLMNSPADTMNESALSDEQIETFIGNPMKIQDYETALEIMQILTDEIANITAQIEAAKIEAEMVGISENRCAWLKRAAYARSKKQSEYQAVMRRGYGLKGPKTPALEQADVKAAEAAAAREIRLIKEAEAQNIKAAAEIERQKFLAEKEKTMQASIAAKKERAARNVEDSLRYERHFINAAKATLPQYLYAEIVNAAHAAVRAKESSPEMVGATGIEPVTLTMST
jgi:hypothetical protein